jgi:2-iminobutanoate/2-iminopropanoate deaminase
MVIADDRTCFLSGLISQDLKTGEVLKGDIVFETKRVLENLETILRRYGSGMDQVIRTEVLLSDFSERDKMNAEYVNIFPKVICRPASVLETWAGLRLQVEIAVTACK